MTKHKNRSRGREVVVSDFWSPEFAAQALAQPPRSTAYTSSSSYRAPRRPAVDPMVLKRAFMLQNFQFILRSDLMSAKAAQGLPQGQRRLVECLRSNDSLVPWEAVHSVVMRGGIDKFECPICLDTPVAPRITECGHVYCLPCMLQYLSTQKANNQDRTCPVCHNRVATFTLRPCVFQPVRVLHSGVEVRFDLFKRERDSCILHRYDDPRLAVGKRMGDLEKEMLLPLYMEPCAVQCRYVLSTLDHDANHRYLDAADISSRLRDIEEMCRPLGEADAAQERFLLDSLNEVTKERKELAPSLTRSSPPLAPRPHDPEGDGKLYEIYAEGEGQPYYLHMLTVKMLKHDAKLRGTESLPDSVFGPIEEITSFTQDEESRRIYKVFAHVPLHGTVKLCMVNLKGVVLPETMAAFQSTLDEHAQRRRERQKADDASADADASWKEYLKKYNPHGAPGAGAPPSPGIGGISDGSFDTDSVPFLQLPSTGSGWSDHGLPPNTLDTRQRATKRNHNDTDALVPATLGDQQPTSGGAVRPSLPGNQSGCWSGGSSAVRLFKASSAAASTSASVQPTWGGHHFDPSKGGGSAKRGR